MIQQQLYIASLIVACGVVCLLVYGIKVHADVLSDGDRAGSLAALIAMGAIAGLIAIATKPEAKG